MPELEEAAALLQLLIKDKVVVHVEVKRQPEQYGSIELEAWLTIHVDPGMSLEDRIALQAEAHAKALASIEAEVEASLQRHRQMRIDAAIAETEEAEACKKALQAKAEAAKVERIALQQAQAAARESIQTVAAIVPSAPRTAVVKPVPKPSPAIVPGKKIITAANPTLSEAEHHDFED